MNKMKKVFFIIIGVLSLAGCESYLDVEPKSSLSEENLFTSETGYQQAITGIYALMASKDLYGDNLSMGFVSALGQNYNQNNTSSPLYNTSKYDFNSDEVVNFGTVIWNKSYNLIAAANKIIENANRQTGILTQAQSNRIKGEALALRAYLHFELLRLYGKSFTYNPNAIAIPYKTIVNEKPTPPSTTKEILDYIIADLNSSADLLKNDTTVDYSLLSSHFTVNYFAVKGILARVYMYYGDAANANAAAKEVINSTHYTFVDPSRVSAQSIYRDRLFTSELVLGLRAKDILDWEQRYFHDYQGNSSNSLTRTETDINSIYELSTGGGTDIRRLYLFEVEGTSIYPTKFWQTSNYTAKETRLDQIVPLIRLSEMYYIAAETETSQTAGAVYLNAVIAARSVNKVVNGAGITPAAYRAEITKEYQKEFYGEGQLFYYYKRLNLSTIPFYANTLSGETYVIPVPDSEKEFNPNYN